MSNFKSYTKISSFAIALCIFSMALPQQFRIFTIVFIALFISIAILTRYYISNQSDNYEIRMISKTAVMFLVTLFSMYGIALLKSEGSELSITKILRPVAELLFCAYLLSVFRVLNPDKVIKSTFRYCAIFSVIYFCASLFTNLSLSSQNFYSALMMPLAIYYLVRKGRWNITHYLYLFSVLGLSWATNARGVLGVLLLCIIFKALSKLSLTKGPVLFALTLAASIGQVLVALDNDPFVNQVLTYRPVIWNYYIHISMENLVFGSGLISESVTEGAASAYALYAQKGVATSYGTQSMLINYFFESGLVGIVFLFTMLWSALLTEKRYGLAVFCLFFLGTMETIKIGSLSIYGGPLTLFLIANLAFIINKKIKPYSHKQSYPESHNSV